MEYYSTSHVISALDIRLSVRIVCNRLVVQYRIKKTEFGLGGFLSDWEEGDLSIIYEGFQEFWSVRAMGMG